MPPNVAPPPCPNFAFLREHEPALVLFAAQAEARFVIDPVASITKLRLFAELLAQETAAHVGLFTSRDEPQSDLLRRLRDRGLLPPDAEQAFHSLRKAGNEAVHRNVGDGRQALHQLKLAHGLAIWFHRTFGKLGPKWKPLPLDPPRQPHDATAPLIAELEETRAALAVAQTAAGLAQTAADEAQRARLSAEERAATEAAERAAAESLMNEAALRETAMNAQLAALQATAVAAPVATVQATVIAASTATFELDEPSTRRLVDEQLRAAGWDADSAALRWSAGTRPQKGKNLAIAEWPTDAGPADYVLFVGLMPVAVIEAKRSGRDVSAALEQAKRYAYAFQSIAGIDAPQPYPNGPYPDGQGKTLQLPFHFATNGRPYLEQIAEKSGIWFRDARRPQNLPRPLVHWYTPDGLTALLKQDIDAAHAKLHVEPTEYLGLREYQLRAIRAAEHAIEDGERTVLLAMATGTGKTRTCIGLCYRLLKTQLFRRILFLVDRSALGEQAANAFKDARLESLQTFDRIFDLKTLDDARPDKDTKLHIATVQGMVQRLLYADDDQVPPVDAYDCIVVDECHRGYLLDREMSDHELAFRSEADYVSKYRRVLEYFDAVKIGLTATPALHTVQIFGQPAYTYSYREAVIDGFLVDHEPPVRIVTALARDGIHWKAGEEVAVYEPQTQRVQLSLLPDEVDIELEDFNRRVLTENFNRVVCETLAKHLDPTLEPKTLIFCATDTHADMVVRLLKQAFVDAYGDVDNDAVVKITGTSDRPLELIRRFKNERLPNVAVTVDLLTTGVDIPKISNIVFIRRIRSRILYDQMLGRATRLCEEIGKEVFHVYDAVDLYSALAPYSEMKPVVANVSIDFKQLTDELTALTDSAHRDAVRDQLIAKLNRKRRHIEGRALDAFEAEAGMDPKDLVDFLRANTTDVARDWFAAHPQLAEILDGRTRSAGGGLLVSQHADSLVSEDRGYGDGRERPEDYLEGFAQYLRTHLNELPALLVVTQRPRDLTREQLKSLRVALDTAGYPEAHLRAAWRDATNQDIAASIIGHVRQAALGDALVPYEERVAKAMKKILATRAWTEPQRRWLERIGRQLKVEVVVDREALDRGQFAAEGGFTRMNKVFEGKLEALLGDLADEVWAAAQ